MRPAGTDVTALVKKLAVGYGRTLTGPETVDTVLVWQDVLDGVPWPEVERAVDATLREPGRFMPKAGEIRSRALDLARKQFGPANPDATVWHTERWTEGVDPDNGAPGLCIKCANRVWFEQRGTVLHGYVAHRALCPNIAVRIVA